MAYLTTCPFCGASVSDDAPECPQCKRRLWSARPRRQAPSPASALIDPAVRSAPAAAREDSPVPMIIYVLLGLGFLYFIPPVLGVVLAYINRGGARGTWLESHYDWQIKTFWVSLLLPLCLLIGGLPLFVLMGSSTMALVLGVAILGGSILWYAWRVIRGAVVLHRGTAIA